MTRSQRWHVLGLIAFVRAGAADDARAASCSVSAQGVAFGTYDEFAGRPTDSTGAIAIRCDTGTTYTLSLSAGNAGRYDPRLLQGADGTLAYNLYVDAGFRIIWGNGAEG